MIIKSGGTHGGVKFVGKNLLILVAFKKQVTGRDQHFPSPEQHLFENK